MAADILERLAAHARERAEADKKIVPLEALKERCADPALRDGGCFEAALRKPGMRFICEVKKASPSKGIISPDFPYLDITRGYEAAGADCVSCLTEPKWFLGNNQIFAEIRREIRLPMIRKDFTVDEYQIWQAKAMGADAVLLIRALLDTQTLEKYLRLCEDLKLTALVETHDADEIASAVSAGARVIGVNNRDLRDFSVDFSNAERLRGMIPADRVYVAESGVKGLEDVAALKKIGADAVLMGEVLMRAPDKAALIRKMRDAK